MWEVEKTQEELGRGKKGNQLLTGEWHKGDMYSRRQRER